LTAIVILNYRTYGEVFRLINSILMIEDPFKPAIYIVDNGGDTEKLSGLVKKCSQLGDIKFLFQETNLGFARGMNVGIARAREDGNEYIVCSNSDIIVPPSFSFSELRRHAIADKKVGLVAPQIFGKNHLAQNPMYFSSPFGGSLFWQIAKIILRIPILGFLIYVIRWSLKNILNRRRPQNNKKDSMTQIKRDFYCLHGAFFMLTPSYFSYYKNLDPGTFLFYEELILAARLRQVDLFSFLDSSNYVIHIEDVATDKKFNGNKLAKTVYVLRENYKSLVYYLAHYE
jgi:GT2 family glycosyltransferase